MILEILKPYEQWKQGDTPDVTRTLATQLVALGVAKIHEDQSRRDIQPKPQEDSEPQQITVNNYYITPDDALIVEPEPEPKKRKGFFNLKK